MNIDGNVSGDVVGGDKSVIQTAGGDIVGGDKITHTGTGHIFAGPGDVVVVQAPISPASARDRANLQILLSKVKTFWIQGVLDRSVHSAFLLELGLELRTEAVEHPWASVLELPDTSRREVPPGTAVSRVFDEANRALLILGEPGSGKTTTMLELARDLVARAEADPQGTQPIPVVFNLSNWHRRRLPLATWLARELSTKYQVPVRLGRAWLKEQRLLPLLDGLDEVAPEGQAACVMAINQFAASQALPGVVVCCRTEEYMRLPVRLGLNGAISIRPLSPEQVDTYLQVGEDRLATLRALLRSDDVLAALARTPLFLSIMSLAYQGVSAEALGEPGLNTLQARRTHLFGHYVAHMLKRKGRRPEHFPDTTLTAWVAWLARHMLRHNQTIFLIERMQPAWIHGRGGRWAYALLSRVSLWLILGLSHGLTFLVILFAVEFFDAALVPELGLALASPARLIVDIMAPFALIGLAAGLLCGVRFELSGDRPPNLSQGTQRRRVTNLVLGSLLPVGLVLSLMLIYQASATGEPLLTALLLAATLSLPIAATAAVATRAWETGDSTVSDVMVVEPLGWSWVSGLTGALIGFAAGALMAGACTFTFLDRLSQAGPLTLVATGALPFGLVGAAAGAIVAGLRARQMEQLPDAKGWIARLLRSGLAGFLTGGGPVGAMGALGLMALFLLAARPETSLWPSAALAASFGLGCLLIFGTVGGLYNGGFSLVQHTALRLVLTAQHRIPWRLSHIAAQAENLVFLRRVGGGYIFIHRLVMEYFAGRPQGREG